MKGSDALFWRIMRNFEDLALRQYQALAPALANEDKRRLVARLESLAPDDALLDQSDMKDRVAALTQILAGRNCRAVLLNEGFLFELVGQAIYRHVYGAKHASDETRELCALGLAANQQTRAATMTSLRLQYPQGDDFLAALIEAAPPLLKAFVSFGEGLDKNFGDAFELNFADILGEVVGEIDEAAVALGADRRKLVGFLASVMMEI